MTSLSLSVGRRFSALLLSALLLLVLLLVTSPHQVAAARLVNGSCPALHNRTGRCSRGVILPLWLPDIASLGVWDRAARATIYFLTLLYMFFGVSIIADRFMAAIEVITSQEKQVVLCAASAATQPHVHHHDNHPPDPEDNMSISNELQQQEQQKNEEEGRGGDAHIACQATPGERVVVSVRVWNETVSNLTLMALGSSAPEILLSIIETCGKDFTAGELGPGTIVGSAAFNLFVIVGICVYIIPTGETRRIRHLGVFCITAAWSLFAYLWLYLIIAKISPARVDVWEALLTLAFFPLTVFTAYIADTRRFIRHCSIRRLVPLPARLKRFYLPAVARRRRLRNHVTAPAPPHHVTITTTNASVAADGSLAQSSCSMTGHREDEQDSEIGAPSKDTFLGKQQQQNGGATMTPLVLNPSSSEIGGSEEWDAFTRNRQKFIELVQTIRKRHPHTDNAKLLDLAREEVQKRCHKSRAYYRMQATRSIIGNIAGSGVTATATASLKSNKLSGTSKSAASAASSSSVTDGGGILKKKKSLKQSVGTASSPPVQHIFFEPDYYTVLENVGSFMLTVFRVGDRLEVPVRVEYATRDGTAVAGEDYVAVRHSLTFQAFESQKHIEITIVDDDIFEEDEYFYVDLIEAVPSVASVANMAVTTAINVGERDSHLDRSASPSPLPPLTVQLVEPCIATIMILDDDHPGVFHFETTELKVAESCQQVEIKVLRSSGARGRILVPYRTMDGTALGRGQDYEDAHGILEFQNDQIEAIIHVRIIDDNDYQKWEYFFVELGKPIANCEEKKPNFWKSNRHLSSNSNIVAASSENIALSQNQTRNCHNLFLLFPSQHQLNTGTGMISASSDFELVNLDNNHDKSTEKVVGTPKLGENKLIKIIIIESEEFKNTVNELLKSGTGTGNPANSLTDSTSTWRDQFVEALKVVSSRQQEDDTSEANQNVASNDENESAVHDKIYLPTFSDYFLHFLTVVWKLIIACVPPIDYGKGWYSFFASIGLIGLTTALIGDLASGFGCTIGLSDAVTSITFVALGTSLPDTFASKVAAISDQYADSSIGNVTGSNAVNVFLGIGLAWSIAAIVRWNRNQTFEVPAGSLGFSVTMFCILALLAILLLLLRRNALIGGEFGGPYRYKLATTMTLIGFWIIYVIFSSLENYCHIAGF